MGAIRPFPAPPAAFQRRGCRRLAASAFPRRLLQPSENESTGSFLTKLLGSAVPVSEPAVGESGEANSVPGLAQNLAAPDGSW